MTKLTFSSTTINAGSNAKTVKGDDEWLTAIMYLAPYKLSGTNLCSMAELAKCHKPCLNLAGRGKFSKIQEARIRKSQRFTSDRQGFMKDLTTDTARFVEKCKLHKVKPAIRLNGTSDIRWELIKIGSTDKNIFETFPEVQFYDYTKIANRKIKQKNYHLTWSYSEADKKYSDFYKTAQKNGLNIAVVFRNKDFPEKYLGWKVVDGDKDDLRFLDKPKSIIGLKAKGPAVKDDSGFVVDA